MAYSPRVLAGCIALVLSAGLNAQPKNACEVLTAADLQPIAGAAHLEDGVSKKSPGTGALTCRYQWGAGGTADSGRFTFEIEIVSASKVFPGMKPDMIKQALPNAPGATVLPGVGDVSIVQSSKPSEVITMTLIKGQSMTITLDGPDAQKKKDAVIALTKLATSKF